MSTNLVYRSNVRYLPTGTSEELGHWSLLVLSVGIIVGSIVAGDKNHNTSTIIVALIACFVTIFWGQYQRSWIMLASIMTAAPLNWPCAFPCNQIFALWLLLFNMNCIHALPKWLLVTALSGVVAFLCSSAGWTSGISASDIVKQSANMVMFLMGPIILIPTIYFRKATESDNLSKLKGLLYYLIIPSTLILIAAYCFGTLIRSTEAEETHLEVDMAMRYELGRSMIDFVRTHVGFILASLICASTPMIILKIKMTYRVLAAICLAINVFLLFFTGSVGSTSACLCSLVCIFFIAARGMSLTRTLISIVAVASVLILVWSLSPAGVKDYVSDRYHERFANKETKGINAVDRFMLWQHAADYILEHPLGVGWSEEYGDKVKMYAHNDYLTYCIGFGVLGGATYAYVVLRLLIYFFRKASSICKDSYALSITLSGLGVLIVVSINSMTDHLSTNPWYFNTLWSIIWYAYFCGQTDSCKSQV